MAQDSEPELPTALVAGKYRLTRLLGKGGMGTVWEGVHADLGTRVAVKFIDVEYAGSDDVRQRFVNEAKAAARLRSKHVVQVYDQGLLEDGRPYIVMEFLSGEPLDARLDRLGTLTPEVTARMVLHIARALAKAHEIGIVHRDLKPENVFLVHDEEDRTDIAKVVDFGIAKFTDPKASGSSSTRTGAVLGTPQYMSPEQARGLRTVDHRTDLWSLGVIVYRCIVGALPFKGEAVGDLLVNVCTADAPAPSSLVPRVPAGFDGFIVRALAREPSLRFQSAAELCDALAAVCGVDARLGPPSGATVAQWTAPTSGEGRAVTEGPFETSSAKDRERRPRSTSFAALAVVFVLVVGVSVFAARGLFRAGGEPGAAAEPPGATKAEPRAASAPPPAPEIVPAAPAPAPSAAPSAGPASAKRAARPPAGRPPAKAEPAKATPPAAKPPSKPADQLGY